MKRGQLCVHVQFKFMRSMSPRYFLSEKIVGNLLRCCLSKCVAVSMKYLNLWLLIFAFTCCKGLNKILLLLQIKSMRILELPYRKTWPPLPLVSMCRLSGSPSQRSQKSSGRTMKPCKQLTMHILYKQGEKKSSFHHLNMKRGITLALVLIQSQ